MTDSPGPRISPARISRAKRLPCPHGKPEHEMRTIAENDAHKRAEPPKTPRGETMVLASAGPPRISGSAAAARTGRNPTLARRGPQTAGVSPHWSNHRDPASARLPRPVRRSACQPTAAGPPDDDSYGP